jgi:serine protease Do
MRAVGWRQRLGRLPKPLLLAVAVGAVVAAGLGVTAVRKLSEPAAVTRTASKPMSFPEIFERVAPAVVAIEVVADGNPLLRFFQQQGDPRAETERQPAGSGFFMSADGLVVTNDHVIEGAREIVVSLHDGRTLPARVVGRDATIDLAVLKVTDPNDRNARFPFVDFEDSAEPRVGDWVLAVGNPFGLGGTATAGIVSAYGRDIESSGLVPYMQLDAAINRGDFGGPSFDVYGRVVGVNTAIFSPSGGGSIGIAFAIPAAVAAETVKALAEGREIARGFIGATIQTLTAEEAAALGLQGRRGALVAGVAKGGPAARAGLRSGDVVTSVEGDAVTSSADLTRRVAGAGPNRRLELEVLRDGKVRSIAVRTGTRPPPRELGAIF